MRILIWVAVAIFIPMMTVGLVAAQERDSVFGDYQGYETFVDDKIMHRDFVELVKALGGRDEYSTRQLDGIQQQFTDIFPIDFRHKTVFKKIDLGGGMTQEARAYWIGERYIYFYALLHQREQDLVVINFTVNSLVGKVLAKF